MGKILTISCYLIFTFLQIILGIWEAYVINLNNYDNIININREIYIYCITKSILNIIAGIIGFITANIILCQYTSNDNNNNNNNNNIQYTVKIYSNPVNNLVNIINMCTTIWGIVRYFDKSFYDQITIELFKIIIYIEIIIFFTNIAILLLLLCCTCCICCITISNNNRF